MRQIRSTVYLTLPAAAAQLTCEVRPRSVDLDNFTVTS